MKRTDIQKLLSINGYWTINKHLAKEFGFTATALLQHLIELQCTYFPNGNFYQQQDTLADTLGISEKILVAARKKLVNAGLLIARRGHSAKYYYTVELDNVAEYFEVDERSYSNMTKGNIRTLQKGATNIKKQEHKEKKQKEVKHKEENNTSGKIQLPKIEFFELVSDTMTILQVEQEVALGIVKEEYEIVD